jgi:hypothetical protein
MTAPDMSRNRLSNLGELMQIAFVPQDFDGAIQHWLKMGAGPFFLLEDNQAEWVSAYGVELPLVLDIAVGNWGDMQIEIIRQKSAGKTIYSDWRKAGREGVHHTCIMVSDMGEARAACRDHGFAVVHEGRHGASEWLYADTHGGPGTLLEILCMPAGAPSLADMTRAATRSWDGTEPVRKLLL